MALKLHTLITDLDQERYHKTKNSFSSTQIKDILEDEEFFVKKHILKTIVREQFSFFDVGSYFHTGILEPHKLRKDCAIYPGPVRRGKEFEEFCLKHKGKAILTRTDQREGDKLIKAVRESPSSMAKIKNGMPEVSMFVRIRIWDGEIYAPHWKMKLSRNGWIGGATVPARGVDVILKVRADLLGDGYILDLKSTSENAKNKHKVKQKISHYSYDLSASLYMDMFTAGTGRLFDKFFWTFASKKFENCKTWQADQDNILIGRAKWRKAVLKLGKLIECDFKFDDCIEFLEPSFFEREHLIEKEEDFL